MTATPRSTVVVLGASANPDRISSQAVQELKSAGYRVVPVHPRAATVHGLACVPTLDAAAALAKDVDTLTVYVNEKISSTLEEGFVDLHPRRVIFNPGSENAKLAKRLEKEGIEVVEACTLVMMRTGQY